MSGIRRAHTGRASPARPGGGRRTIDFTDDFARANGTPRSLPGFRWRKHDEAEAWAMEIVGEQLDSVADVDFNWVMLESTLDHPLECSAKIVHSGFHADDWFVKWKVGNFFVRAGGQHHAAVVHYVKPDDRWRLEVKYGVAQQETAWQAGEPVSGTVLKLITSLDSARWPAYPAWMTLRAEFGALSKEVEGMNSALDVYPFLGIDAQQAGGVPSLGTYSFDDYAAKGLLTGWIPPA